jgi:thiol-disulfide isomerase/thioredoxin
MPVATPCGGRVNTMNRTKRFLVGARILIAIQCVTVSAQEVSGVKLENAPGWVWRLRPNSAGTDWTSANTAGLAMRLDELKSGKLLFSLAHTLDSTRNIARFRPVAFNAAGRRFEFSPDSGGSTEGVTLEAFTLDLASVPREQIKYLGLEELSHDNLRDIVAPAAFHQLTNGAANALQFPRAGDRYDFELSAINGQVITSRELHDKVVLLDFWASWCPPCMAELGKIKEIYQKLNSRGFEVIGLNHDWTIEAARRAIAKQELPWPNVLAPTQKEERELWATACDTAALPRLLLIDQDGVLQNDCPFLELEREIEKLLNRK